MNERDSSWFGKKCLVTGAFGFVGTHLCRELIGKGADVTALDHLASAKGTYFGLLGLEQSLSVLRADVRRMDSLGVLQESNFDLIFHLAAQPISPLSNLSSEDTMHTNVGGTANVGRAIAREESPPGFVFASSACWYGATSTSPLKEDDPFVEGEFKYSESKVLAEEEVKKMESEYNTPTVRCRFVNLYGPGDRHFSRLVPKTIRHLLNGERPCLLRNNGSTVLDFMHVEDAVSALLSAGAHCDSIRGGVFNFGVGDGNPRSARETARLVSLLFDGKEREPEITNPVEPRTIKKFLDSTKARSRLNWRPTRLIEEGLPKTIDWYKENIAAIEHLEY
jgi:CDP-glucose 4,6-dehydratase